MKIVFAIIFFVLLSYMYYSYKTAMAVNSDFDPDYID